MQKKHLMILRLACVFSTSEANIQEKMDYLSTQTAALSGLSGKVGSKALRESLGVAKT